MDIDFDAYTFALKNALDEAKNICPDITSIFIFNKEGKIIANDQNTPEKTITRVINAFNGMLEKAEAIGGIENITLECSNGKVDVAHTNDFYLVTVTSANANIDRINTITKVLIPTVLRLLEKICPTPLKGTQPPIETKPEQAKPQAEQQPIEKPHVKEKAESIQPESKTEPQLPEPPVNQLIVENWEGLLTPSDTVRIDSTILSKWEQLYEGRKIEEVEISTFNGKVTRCKVKPTKGTKHAASGVIQVPEKIRATLQIEKGELVRAKPIIK
ncbi:MAG: hypothetical protein QXG27_01005 [Candidatus Bathyarchaeia archaeon]